MKKYIVDASVILVGLLESRTSLIDKVREIFVFAREGKCELASSSFLKIEVANGLRFNERDANKGSKLFQGFFDLPVKYFTLTKTQYKKALEMSYKLGTTVYDTSYHVLAKAQNATFLTCDEDYYKKAKILGDIELID